MNGRTPEDMNKTIDANNRSHNGPGVTGGQFAIERTDEPIVFVGPTTARSLAVATVPRTRDEATWDYYAATDLKHFGDRSEPGSKFLAEELRTIEDVVTLAARQRGDLQGDDRDLFIARGAHPDAFRDSNRYLFVETPGTVGVIRSTDLDDATLLNVVRTKPGAPCSLVVPVDEQPVTDYAVIVVSADQSTGEDLVITTFPGIVTKSLENEFIESLEGGALTVAAARDLLGEGFWVNTRVAQQPA